MDHSCRARRPMRSGASSRLRVRGALSIQEQLVRFFRREVATGALRPGTRLPASRSLAQELKLARGTVSGAYERLAAEGFLVARHGFGTLVAGQLAPPKCAPGRLSRAVGEFAGSRRALELMKARPHETHAAWPLTPGVPALDAFPFALWARLNAAFPPSAERRRSRLWRTSRLPSLARGDRRLCRRGARHHLLARQCPRRHRHPIGDLYRRARGRRSRRARLRRGSGL